MKLTIEIEGKRYSSKGDDILEVLTKLLIEAGEIDDDGFLSVIDGEDSAILNYAH